MTIISENEIFSLLKNYAHIVSPTKICLVEIRLIERKSFGMFGILYNYSVLTYDDCFFGKSDDALYKRSSGLCRYIENDNIASSGLPKLVRHTVYDEIVQIVERRFHRGAGNYVRRRYKESNEEQIGRG